MYNKFLMDLSKFSGDLLENEPLCNPVVVIFGTVGSNSAVETTRSGALCVFSEETVRDSPCFP